MKAISAGVTILTLILALAYLSGFVLWNHYLLRFGFFEYDVLQTRFISAGLLFLGKFFLYLQLEVILLFLILVPNRIKNEIKLFFQSDEKRLFVVKTISLFVLIILLPSVINWTKNFAQKDFFEISQFWGGAKPFPITMIINPDSTNTLRKLDIEFSNAGEGAAEIQTEPVCILYQNSESILLGVVKPLEKITTRTEIQTTIQVKANSRIINLNRKYVEGFAPVPIQNATDAYMEKCASFMELGWYY